MAEANFTLETIYGEWEKYQDWLKGAIAPLRAEQLTLRSAPHLRTIAELVQHIVGTRVGWLQHFLGEELAEQQQLSYFDDPNEENAVRTAAELVSDLDVSWGMVRSRLERWTPEDMQQSFTRTRGDRTRTATRSWVIWHLLEHDLHHGGEVSLTLGINGLQVPNI